MTSNAHMLVAAALMLVILTFLVSGRLLFTRVQEMKRKRIDPQAVATSAQMAAQLENTQAADNFRNLFEIPVLFYALVATAVALHHTPTWLVYGAWLFVVLRVVHSLIHCTYNRVMHRLAAFLVGLVVVVFLWLLWFVSLPGAAA